MRKSAMRQVERYVSLLEKMGSPYTASRQLETYQEEMLTQVFESLQSVVPNDIYPEEKQEMTIQTYLESMRVQYPDGLYFSAPSLEISPVLYDNSQKKKFIQVKVVRGFRGQHTSWGNFLGKRTLYVFVYELDTKPRINRISDVVEDAPTPYPIDTPENKVPERISAPITPACIAAQREAESFLRKMKTMSGGLIDKEELRQAYEQINQLQIACEEEKVDSVILKSQSLGDSIRPIAEEIERLIEAKAVANTLTKTLNDKGRNGGLYRVSRRGIRRYMKKIDQSVAQLTSSQLQSSLRLLDQKQMERKRLNDFYQTAVRHPRLHVKVVGGANLFISQGANFSSPENTVSLYSNTLQGVIGFRNNRVKQASTIPNSKTKKRSLVRAHVFGIFLGHTETLLPIPTLTPSANPFNIQQSRFQEAEMGCILWEWWRLSGGVGRQVFSDASGSLVSRTYATVTTSLSLRFLHIFELEGGCTGLLASFLPSMTLRPFGGVGLILKV